VLIQLVLVVDLLWELHIQVAVLKDDWFYWIPDYNILNSLAVSILVHLELSCSMLHSTMLHHAIILLMLIMAHMVL
jgi:hypothetical protein